jgi:O-succinylbenzoate synthase
VRPVIYRVYRDELLSLSEIARRSGFSRDAVERAAKRSHDVTERLTWLRQRADMRMCAAALGLHMATVRMRLSRGKSIADALRA